MHTTGGRIPRTIAIDPVCGKWPRLGPSTGRATLFGQSARCAGCRVPDEKLPIREYLRDSDESD